MIWPTGDGIGATQLGWLDMSPARAAGSPAMNTVADPLAIKPGPAGTHGTNVHILVISVARAAGRLPIRTVGAQGGIIGKGRAGCGTGVGTGAGGCIGAWQWGADCSTISVILAAGGAIPAPHPLVCRSGDLHGFMVLVRNCPQGRSDQS